MSDIMQMFRTAPQAANPLPAGPTGVNQPGVALPSTQSTQQTAPNGVVPAGATDPASTEPASPLATFEKVWETTPNPAEPDGPMFAGVDPQKLMESAGKVDFAKAATPEQLAAINAGGTAATEAMMQVMNKVAQTVFAQSAFATTKIVDQAMTKQQENFAKQLPSLVKKLSVNDGLQASNPLLSNPALTPLVSALTEQFTRKNPSATASEIQSQVNDYFAAVGQVFAPKAPETAATRAATQKAKSEDWSAFFE